MKTKRFYLRALADSDLEDIYVYSLEQFGQVRAEQYVNDLIDSFE